MTAAMNVKANPIWLNIFLWPGATAWIDTIKVTYTRIIKIAKGIHRKSFGYWATVSRYGYSAQFSGQFAPEMGIAVIAKPKVTSVRTTVKIAE